MSRFRRSPLSGASTQQVAALRGLVAAHLRWERAAGTAAQTVPPDLSGVRTHLLPIEVEVAVEERSRARLAVRPNAGRIEQVDRDLRAAKQSPRKWRQERTLAALEGIHTELTRIVTASPRGRA